VYTLETSCRKGTSLHIKNIWIKQLFKCKARDFAIALQAQNVSGVFEIWAPEMMKERSGHKTKHSVQEGNWQSSEGIVRIVATKGKYLRLFLTPNRLSSYPQKKPRKRRKQFSMTSYSKSVKRFNCMICCVWFKISTLVLEMTANTMIRLWGKIGMVTSTATYTDPVISVRRI